MKINHLIQLFEERGYQKVAANRENVFLYYKEQEEEREDENRPEGKGLAYVAVIWDLEETGVPEGPAYEGMLDHIRWSFLNWGFAQVELLNLLCTWDTESARSLCTDEGDHWIVNMGTGQVIIYENQRNCFWDVEDVIQEAGKPVSLKKLPLCTIGILLVNFVVFLLVELTGGDSIENMLKWGAMCWPYVTEGKEIFRLFTYMFLHFGVEHLINNMFVLFFIGQIVEKYMGKVKYTVLYFSSGILAGVASMVYNMIEKNVVVSAGASGAVFGVIGAIAFIILINRGKLADLTPGRMVFFIILSFYGGFAGQGVDNMAHIGGFISGFILSAILYRKQRKRDLKQLDTE